MDEESNLNLLYDGGVKSKPLFPLILNENNEFVGRELGHHSISAISEWADMVYFDFGKQKKSDRCNSSIYLKYLCIQECGSVLQISMYFHSTSNVRPSFDGLFFFHVDRRQSGWLVIDYVHHENNCTCVCKLSSKIVASLYGPYFRSTRPYF